MVLPRATGAGLLLLLALMPRSHGVAAAQVGAVGLLPPARWAVEAVVARLETSGTVTEEVSPRGAGTALHASAFEGECESDT
jgi:hypothetical protein